MFYQILKKRDSIKNESQKKQRGRSMVEMLGVLAIIGVLSIGGISGYTIAMRRYKANEILNVMQKYALTVYTEAESKMRNDPEHYYINARGHWIHSSGGLVDAIAFSNSGLGGMPSGLTQIYLVDILSTQSSGDIVRILMYFSDEALCRTTAIIADDYEKGRRCSDPRFMVADFYMN